MLPFYVNIFAYLLTGCWVKVRGRPTYTGVPKGHQTNRYLEDC